MSDTDFETRKDQASAWFRTLRDTIVARFEALEDSTDGDTAAGRFEVTPTTRDEGRGGGGIMSGVIIGSGVGGMSASIRSITSCQISAGRPPPVVPVKGVLLSLPIQTPVT